MYTDMKICHRTEWKRLHRIDAKDGMLLDDDYLNLADERYRNGLCVCITSIILKHLLA